MQILPAVQIRAPKNVYFHHSGRIFAYKEPQGSAQDICKPQHEHTTTLIGKLHRRTNIHHAINQQIAPP